MYRYIFITLLLAVVACTNPREERNDQNQEIAVEQVEARSEIIDAEKINRKIAEGKTILYKNATITGDIDFCSGGEKNLVNPQLLKRYLSESVTFYNCTFKGKIIAQRETSGQIDVCRFRKHLTFMHCTFQDTVNFRMVDFDEVVNFSNSDFQEVTDFSGANFMYRQNFFGRTKFLKTAAFNLMNVTGNIDFFEAEFYADAIFQLSQFAKETTFNSSVFHGNVDFSNVKFADDVFFNYAEFVKKSIWSNVLFAGRTEYNYASFKTFTNFTKCIFYRKPEFTESNIKGIFTFKNNEFLSREISKTEFPKQKGTDFVFD